MALILTQSFLVSLLFGAVTAGLPLLLAGLGEQISEKAGVLNIGLEGMMLIGAYCGFVVAYYSNSFALGFLGGGLGGTAAAALIVILCVQLGLSQVVTGIALTLGAQGLTALLHHFQFARSYPRLGDAPVFAVPFLSTIPIIGPAFFAHNIMVYATLFLVAALAWIFRKTYLGLNLEAAGANPAALDAAGISVTKVRAGAVLTTGFLSGVGGAYLANVGAGLFVPFITHGAGFIGIVLAMLARGKPGWVFAGAMVFGLSLSLTTALQVAGINVPTDIVQMLPFIVVLGMLFVFSRNANLPSSLGLYYKRGER